MSQGGVIWLRVWALGTLGFCVAMYLYLRSVLGEAPIVVPIAGAVACAIMIAISMGPARRRRFLEHAVEGRATIVGVRTTGILINNVPVLDYELKVQGPSGEPYTAHDRVTAFPGSVPNRGTFRCAIDPKRAKKVVLLLDKPTADRETESAAMYVESASAGAIAGALRTHGSGMRNISAAELLAKGQRMTAVVRAFSPTGKTAGELTPGAPSGDDPMYVFQLEIPMEGASPIEAICVHRVPAAKVDGLRLGERLSVAVNPANPTREVAIDWETSPISV